MTVREVVVKWKYDIDKQSEKDVLEKGKKTEQKAGNALKGIKAGIAGILAVITGGIVKSLEQTIERYQQINERLDYATNGLASQVDLQHQVNDAANETRMTYESMAGTVTSLLNSYNKLFANPENAVNFATLSAKALRGAGLSESAVASISGGMASSFVSGKLGSGTFSQIMTQAPQILKYLSDTLGVSIQQVKALGTAGYITANQLYAALTSHADDIDKQFGEISFKISDAITYAKNQFNMFLSDVNENFEFTNNIAKDIKKWIDQISDDLMDIMNRIEAFLKTPEGERLKQSLRELTDNILASLADLLELILSLATALVPILQPIFDVLNKIVPIVSDVVQQYLPQIQQFVESIAQFLSPIIELIGSIIGTLVEVTANITSSSKAMSVLTKIFEWLTPVIKLLCKVLEPLVTIVGKFMEIFGRLTDGIFSVIDHIIPSMSDVVGKNNTNNTTINYTANTTLNGGTFEDQKKLSDSMQESTEDAVDYMSRVMIYA